MRVEHDGEYAVVASKGGADDHPVWYWNLRKHPHVELQDGAEKHDYEAREASGDERAEWWERALEVWPDYGQVPGADRPGDPPLRADAHRHLSAAGGVRASAS